MNQRNASRLGIEVLERKQLLAGDVTVTLIHGNLLIEGDAEANQIVVSSGETPGSYVIRGLDGTTVRLADVEGEPTSEVTVEGVTRHVGVRMGDGDDVVNVSDAQFARGLSIATGNGADVVRIGGADAPDPALAAAADAALAERNVMVRGHLTVATGAEADRVRVADTAVGGLIMVAAGEGDDAVHIGAPDPSTPEATAADGSAADADVIARFGVTALLGDGNDTATLRSVSSRGVAAIGGGDGDNVIGIDGLTAHALGVRTGAGADVVRLADVDVRQAGVATGDGNDTVRIAEAAFRSLAVTLGGGDDLLAVSGTTARIALLTGGEGEADEFQNGAGNELSTLIVRGFETPADANRGSLRLGAIGRLIRELSNRRPGR